MDTISLHLVLLRILSLSTELGSACMPVRHNEDRIMETIVRGGLLGCVDTVQAKANENGKFLFESDQHLSFPVGAHLPYAKRAIRFSPHTKSYVLLQCILSNDDNSIEWPIKDFDGDAKGAMDQCGRLLQCLLQISLEYAAFNMALTGAIIELTRSLA